MKHQATLLFPLHPSRGELKSSSLIFNFPFCTFPQPKAEINHILLNILLTTDFKIFMIHIHFPHVSEISFKNVSNISVSVFIQYLDEKFENELHKIVLV